MRNGWKRLFTCLLAASLLLGALPARAAEAVPGTLPIEEAKGYIFALRADAPLLFQMEETPGVEAVSAANGVYRADTMEEIEAFVPVELLEYVTPDYAVESHAEPTDPDYTNGKEWSLKMLDMDYAWENNLTGAGVRVGIVDSGVRRTHEDFNRAEIVPGAYYPSGTDPVQPGTDDPKDPNDPTKPTNAHGTFVAGLIAATPNNGKGIAGVAPGVELVPLTAFVDNKVTYLSAICRAIYAGVNDYQCDILNMSLGVYADKPLSDGTMPDLTPLEEAVAYAQGKGNVLVASVGNDSGTMLSYPAAYPGVIGVGSVNKKGEKAHDSQYNSSVFVAAPGENVYSLAYNSDTGYATGSGTSYAAPQVAAAAALALEYDPGLTAERIMELIATTAVDKGETGRDDKYGHGLLDVSAFLKAITLPWVTMEGAPGGVTISVRCCKQAEGGRATVLAAAYDEDGRMVDMDSASAVVSAEGVVQVSGLYLDTTADARTVRVYLWDAQTGAPLSKSTTLTLN